MDHMLYHMVLALSLQQGGSRTPTQAGATKLWIQVTGVEAVQTSGVLDGLVQVSF